MTTPRTIQYYFDKARPVFLAISGMTELSGAKGDDYKKLAQQYPDAAFALSTASSLFHHNRELSEIHQQTFLAIVEGEDISSVRSRFERSTDYLFPETSLGLLCINQNTSL